MSSEPQISRLPSPLAVAINVNLDAARESAISVPWVGQRGDLSNAPLASGFGALRGLTATFDDMLWMTVP